MSTFTVVLVVIWALPIVGVGMAYVVLSRRITRELNAMGRNHVDASLEADYTVRIPRTRRSDGLVTREEHSFSPHRPALEVEVGSLHDIDVFTISKN